MLKFTKNPTFQWPVVVQVPQDEGRKAAVQFSAQFRVISPDRFAALAQRRGPAAADPADLAVLAEIVLGWDQVVDADGQALPFSDENLKALAGVPYIRTALFDAYFAAVSGKPLSDAQRGN